MPNTTTEPPSTDGLAVAANLRLDRIEGHLKAIATTVREGFTGVHYALDELREDIRMRNNRDLEEYQERVDTERRLQTLERALRATG